MSGVPLRVTAGVLLATSLLGIRSAFAEPGDLDPAFGEGGLAPPTGIQIDATAVAHQADGKLVVVGAYDSIPGNYPDFLLDDHDFIVARLNTDGTVDTDFGIGGAAIADYAGYMDVPYAVVLQPPDGKVVMAGRVLLSGGIDFREPGGDIGVARFNADGTLDATFGDGGWTVIDLGGFDDAAYCVISQPGGRLVLGVSTNAGGVYHPAFLRLTGTGELDATFGAAGIALLDFAEDNVHFRDRSRQCAQQSSGKLVWVGALGAPSIGVARLTADGSPDVTFGAEGILTIPTEGPWESLFSIAVQPDDIILTAGSERIGAASYGVLRRLSPAGLPDANFGSGGKVLVDSHVAALVGQADGTIVATGSRARGEYYSDLILTRFTAAGAIDTRFGIDGVAVADFGANSGISNLTGRDLIRQADGKYVVVGWTFAGGPANSLHVARFDDSANTPGHIGFTDTYRSAEESGGSVSYTVRRTGGRSGTVSVSYATSDGDAQGGADFESHSGTLSWGDDEVDEKKLRIHLIDDSDAESPEFFRLTLTDPTGGALLAASKARAEIESEDTPSGSGGGDSGGGDSGGSGGSGALACLELLGLAAVAWLGRVVTLAASAHTFKRKCRTGAGQRPSGKGHKLSSNCTVKRWFERPVSSAQQTLAPDLGKRSD
jgi:uncharacterized delta-60 repeat protein